MSKLIGILLSLVLCAPVLVYAGALTNGTNPTGATSFSTASITPTANACVLLSLASRVANIAGGPADPSSITGNGLTWVKVVSRSNAAVDATDLASSRIWIYRAMGAAPTAGAITFTWAASQTHAAWDVTEYTSADTSGTNCSGALVQSAANNSIIQGGTASPATVTMGSAPGSASNTTHAFSRYAFNTAMTPGTNFTQLSQNGNATDGARYLAENGLNLQTATVNNAGTSAWTIIAVEVKAAVAASGCTGALLLMGVGGC